MRVRFVERQRPVVAEDVKLKGLCGPLSYLSSGSRYEVVCLEDRGGEGVYVYLFLGLETSYPPPYPLGLFEVEEEEFPSSWIEVVHRVGEIEIRRTSFPEWAKNIHFFEELVEEELEAVENYKKGCLELEGREF